MSDVAKGVRFHLLGPIRLFVGDAEITVTGRERTLLVTLLSCADMPVEMDRLIDAIWGDQPPRHARNQVQSCVSRLRKRLATAGVREPIILTEPAGYRINVDARHLDLLRFRERLASARGAASRSRDADAVARYRTALSMWQGPALAGVESDALRRVAATLDEEHLRAVEERIDLELALGHGGELVADLTDLVAKHPYRERLHSALMLALYRAGRQAEALMAYQRAREMLVGEIGTEPGSALRDMHQRILTGDPSLVAQVSAGEDRPTPRHCLPRRVDDFTGRQEAVAELVEAARARRGTTAVLTIDGMAGVGKTTLAVHVAHSLIDAYPDAQLFIDLHGHSEQTPVDSAAALATLLRQLGVPSGRIPIELEDRAALWRHEVARRRVLAVLDNAGSASQVEPLLPASSGSLVLVTSRQRLIGLEAARPLSLDVLTPDEAVGLLQRIAGGRVLREPRVATELADRCGHLPLAIRLAGARLVHRPGWQLADLMERFEGAHGLLTDLAGEEKTVADAFRLSYEQLTSELRRTFRLLGLLPGEEFDAWVVAALVDLPVAEAKRALESLVDRHLVQEPRRERYRLHDLVREYASEIATATETSGERDAALRRVFDYYLHGAAATTMLMEPPSGRRSFHTGEPMRPELLARPAKDGIGWLEMERANLVAAVRCAAAYGYSREAWRLARAGWVYFYRRGYLDDLLESHTVGLAAAERLSDDQAVATMCNYLASAYDKLGQFGRAQALLNRAFSLRLRLGDRHGAAIAQMNLAHVYGRLGRLTEAVEHHERALAVRQRIGDLTGMGTSLQSLGLAFAMLGRYADAARCHRRRLAISRETGDIAGCANPLGGLGAIRIQVGDYELARRLLTASLLLKRRVGARDSEAVVVNDLGVLHRMLGQYRNAIAYHREALAIAQDVGDRPAMCAAKNELGFTLRAAGEVVNALEQHEAVVAESTKIKLKYQQARALDGIAACLRDSDPSEARRHWQRALVLYREMGVPEQAEVERCLSELPHQARVSAGSSGRTRGR